jgi:hypothetical protein
MREFARIFVLAFAFCLVAGDALGQSPSRAPEVVPTPAAPSTPPTEYAALEKLIQDAAVAHLPRKYEDHSGWTGSVPIDPTMRLQHRRRQIEVNGRMEWPHGAWKRNKLWLDNPAKDVHLRINEFRRLDNGKVRLVLAATVAGHVEHERLRWRNGIPLLNYTVYADGVITATFDCDVDVILSATTIPPSLSIVPTVTACKLELKDYALRQVGPVAGDGVREIGNELKDIVAELIHSYEPKAKELANRAIAKALKEGKGTLPASVLLKAVPKGRN